MGHMVDGVYFVDDEAGPAGASGEFKRAPSVVRNWVTQDGAAGPTGVGGFKAEPERYHLFVAWNCPWAHRTLLARAFKRLQGDISISVAAPRRTEQGWVFNDDYPEPLYGDQSVHQIYSRDPGAYTGRITVPVLWDKTSEQMVSNESADIVRMLDGWGRGARLYPAEVSSQIDRWNALIYQNVNNGVYRAGFAGTQKAYEAAARQVFETLDEIDAQLARTRYLTGDVFTEADLRLFPTLARFDVAYHYAFKCNLKKLSDYGHLWPYAREVYQMSGVAETVKFDIYKQGYFSPSEKRNPLGIVPIGPTVDWSAPHGRS